MHTSYARFVLIIFIAALLGWAAYRVLAGRSQSPAWRVEFDRELEDARRAAEEARLADKEGGATPQETLARYIDALEKREYERASDYFIEEKRAAEREALGGASPEAVAALIDSLRRALATEGSYSLDKQAYTIRTPIMVDFVRYPNGAWKMVEI